jgi:hypothetical protein
MLILLALLAFEVGLARAQSRDRPLDLRVTGMLLASEEPQREDVFTVPIVVRSTPLLLRIGQVEEVTSSARVQVHDAEVLLHEVRFSGPAALMERLLQPALRGRVLRIDGWLEPKARQFLVTAIEEAPGTAPTPQGQ